MILRGDLTRITPNLRGGHCNLCIRARVGAFHFYCSFLCLIGSFRSYELYKVANFVLRFSYNNFLALLGANYLQSSVDKVKIDAVNILEILHKDGPGFNSKPVLNDLGVKVFGLLVREVLFGISKSVNYANKNPGAKLGYKFFMWSGEQESYKHTTI
ncbi:hypothetical protein RD792_013829 [Penstemon davidsonii]|uniref:Uncharacterized protein n=1 Tax=Penstemon davidsonii TaxID=160366 RepID=A0ABR0CW31_9LAMI|nr:hypothetical protein RD792_013829 [Penstemon davidsonii]